MLIGWIPFAKEKAGCGLFELSHDRLYGRGRRNGDYLVQRPQDELRILQGEPFGDAMKQVAARVTPIPIGRLRVLQDPRNRMLLVEEPGEQRRAGLGRVFVCEDTIPQFRNRRVTVYRRSLAKNPCIGGEVDGIKRLQPRECSLECLAGGRFCQTDAQRAPCLLFVQKRVSDPLRRAHRAASLDADRAHAPPRSVP